MAKNTQEAEVIVTMNGQAAKRAVAELAQEFDRLQKEALEAYKAGNDALGKKLDAQAQKLSKDIEITRRETKKFADVMKNINGASLKELNSAAKQLRSEINKLTPGTQEFITKSKQLQEVNTRITQLKGSFKGLVAEEKAATITLKGLSEGFNRYFAMITAGIAAITGVSMALKKCATDAASMDDAYATVMKTTGLTHEEVEKLNEAFKKMDTRTAREELNKMAYEAGKLGYTGVENIRQFVEAADVINVALGDVLGEGATLEIAKLAQVFSKSTEALDNLDLKGRMLAVGSAVNQLGKDSTASESYMVEFLGRLGGVAVQAGLSADQILGFASALDQTKQKVEMSATAFQKLIQQMIKKPEEFLEAAQMPLEEFKELMATDMNGAILKVLQGFQEMGGFLEQVPMFKEMGLDGARAAGVMSSLAGNLELVARAQSVANEHIRLGTSMTREYNIMNSSMQARLEKARKEFKDICIELGQKLNPIMLQSTKATTYLIKVLTKYGKEIGVAALAVGGFTVAVKMHTIAHKAHNAVIKAGTVLQSTWTVVSKAASYAINLLRGRTIAATKAYIAMNAAMSASVFGVIALAVAGLAAAITHLVRKQREAAETTDYLAEAERQANEEYGRQAGKIKALTAIVENNNIALGQRKKALEELKRIVPGYHGDLTEEGRLINSNKKAIDDYCKSLRQQIKLKAREDQLLEIETKIAAFEDQKADAEERMQQALIDAGGNAAETRQKKREHYNRATGDYYETYAGTELTPYGQAKQDAEGFQSQIDELESQAEKLEARTVELTKKIAEETQTVVEEEQDKINTILSQTQFEYLQQREDKLTKKEREMVVKKYEDLTEDESKALKARYDKLMKADIKAEDKRYQEQVKQLQKEQKAAENDLLSKFLHGEGNMTYKEYQEGLVRIQKSFLQERLVLAKQEGKDTSEIEAQLLKLRSNKMKQEYSEQLNELNECYSDEQRALKMSLMAQEITQDEYDSQMLESKVRYLKEKLELASEYGQDETDIMQAYQEAIKESQDLAFEQIEKLKKRAQEVTDSVNPKEANARQEDLELKELQDLYDLKLISEETFQKKKSEIVKKYGKANLDEDLKNVQEYAQKANQIMEGASNFVTALKDAESAKLEAEYQAQLTAAGDNAEKREQIEKEYEQKQLDLKKKYADTEMAVNIAKTIASGAVAAIKAYAEGGPYLGVALAALIAATTAAEVATIIAQRNAIKNTSVSGSSSSSSMETGKRTLTGYSEGGDTPWAASDDTPVGIVHANEWVAPAWMKRREPVLFANLERYRKAGSHGRSGSPSRGFADGGNTGNGTHGRNGSKTNNYSDDIYHIVKTAVVDVFESGAVRVVLVRKDLTELDNQNERFKNQTSR